MTYIVGLKGMILIGIVISDINFDSKSSFMLSKQNQVYLSKLGSIEFLAL